MRVASDFMLREIAGEYVIIPVGSSALKFNGLITVNDTGAFLWKLLQEETTQEALVEAMLQEYEVDSQTASQDVADFLAYLGEKDLLL